MMEHSSRKQPTVGGPRAAQLVARWSPAVLVAGLTLFHAVNNWIWLDKNVVTRGWDRIGSLVNSLLYHQTLSTFGLSSLFTALTQDQFRPPLFGFSMAIMYHLFGVSADVAVMVNVVYLFVLLAASYGIGTRLGGRCLGMLSAILVASIPLVFAMTRYSYFEFSLTALTALGVYCLLACERFERRSVAIGLGLSLGLGLLVKRTFPVFVLGAGGVVFFQAGLPRKLGIQAKIAFRLRGRTRPRWRDIGLAIAGGALLTALWYLPNRDLAATFSAGSWLFFLWWMLAALAIFFLLQPSSPTNNFLTAFFVCLAVASVWYLPHGFEFVKQILWLAWGVEDPRGRAVDFGSLSTYTEYLQSIWHGFSPFYTLLLFLVLGLLVLYLIQRRRRFLPIPWWDWDWWGVLATIGVAYAVLSTSIYKEPRAITPLLPLLGIVLAGTLLALPWRWPRTALIALVIVFGLVQFFAISYTEIHWLVEKTRFKKPILGQWSIFAGGAYLEVPDSGHNDPGFWIIDDVLQRVETGRQSQGREAISLGVLAGSSYVHAGMFAYEQMLRYPAIHVESPVQAHPSESPYSMAFRYDYVLVLSEGSRGQAMREAVNLVLGKRRLLFERAFALETIYSLPDGSDVYLFERRYPSIQVYDDAALHETADFLHQAAGEGETVVVLSASLLNGLLEHYWGVARLLLPDEMASTAPRPTRTLLVAPGDADLDVWFQEYGPSVQDVQFGELRVVVFE
jgi:4-amino-4-deoxy-L-arabinose transferase-like glycosyltransferase